MRERLDFEVRRTRVEETETVHVSIEREADRDEQADRRELAAVPERAGLLLRGLRASWEGLKWFTKTFLAVLIGRLWRS